MINYHNKRFRRIHQSDHTKTAVETIFHYRQSGSIITCEYEGEDIARGYILGTVENNGSIMLSYQQITHQGTILQGMGVSFPVMLENGRIRLYESRWDTLGSDLEDESILDEIQSEISK